MPPLIWRNKRKIARSARPASPARGSRKASSRGSGQLLLSSVDRGILSASTCSVVKAASCFLRPRLLQRSNAVFTCEHIKGSKGIVK